MAARPDADLSLWDVPKWIASDLVGLSAMPFSQNETQTEVKVMTIVNRCRMPWLWTAVTYGCYRRWTSATTNRSVVVFEADCLLAGCTCYSCLIRSVPRRTEQFSHRVQYLRRNSESASVLTLAYHPLGWPQSRRKKFPEFSRLFPSHKLTFPQVITTKSKCNTDFINVIMTFIPHQLQQYNRSPPFTVIIYWAGSLHPEILIILFTQSTAVLHKYLNDELKILCYNFSLRLHRIPWVFHVQRNPRVFQVCGQPVLVISPPTSSRFYSFFDNCKRVAVPGGSVRYDVVVSQRVLVQMYKCLFIHWSINKHGS